MTQADKVNFYNQHKLTIHPEIKTQSATKSLWRRLFWSTARDSDIYKAGCVDIFVGNFPEQFSNLINRNK